MIDVVARLSVSCAVSAMVWLALYRPQRGIPTQGVHEYGGSARVTLSLPLVLEMLIVSIRHGASIPTALHTLGALIAGPFGAGLLRVTSALQRGCTWREAWSLVDGDERYATAFTQIDLALQDSWRYGQSPVASLRAAIERLRAHQHEDIEQQAARLSVRLLLPTGLCFLPAFIFIGVIPAIASMVA